MTLYSVLVQNIRQSNGADPSIIPNYMCDFNPAAHQEEFCEDLKEASRIGNVGRVLGGG
jgi:hypothetical protein